MQKLADQEIVIREFSKNGSTKLVLKVGIYKGNPFADLRTCFLSDKEEWAMTQKGIRIHAESIQDLIAALQEGDEKLDVLYASSGSDK